MRKLSSFRWALLGALTLQSVVPLPVLLAGDRFGGWSKPRPKTPIEEMAAAIDQLEKRIDTYGSVVIKQPDVWGEARWTAHRQDYEKILKEELNKFKFTINAQIEQADSAFLMNALALGAAAQPGAQATVPQVTQVFQSSSFPQPTALALPTAKILDPRDRTVVDGVAIEPTLFLDQLSRYVEHLNQLRRINEGDDTADAPGYALNLVRLPVSILPGDQTRTGYGAEVSLTLTPELSDDLLPETFKDFALNDVVDQLGLPVVRLAERTPWSTSSRIEREMQIENSQYRKIATYLAISNDKGRPFLDRVTALKNAAVIGHNTIGDGNAATLAVLPADTKDGVARKRLELRSLLDEALKGPSENADPHRLDDLIDLAMAFHAIALHASSPSNTIATHEYVNGHFGNLRDKILAALSSHRSNPIEERDARRGLEEIERFVSKVARRSHSNLADAVYEDFSLVAASAWKSDSTDPGDLILNHVSGVARPSAYDRLLQYDPRRNIVEQVSKPFPEKDGDALLLQDDNLRQMFDGSGSKLDVPAIKKTPLTWPFMFRFAEAIVRLYPQSSKEEQEFLVVLYQVGEGLVRGTVKPDDRDTSISQIEELREHAYATAEDAQRTITNIASQVTDAAQNLSVQEIVASATNLAIASPRHRQARYPVSPTQLACVFGNDELLEIAKALENATSANGQHQIHLMDAHGFLTEELEAAYALLASLKQEGVYDAWTCLCPRISRAVRQLDYSASMEALPILRGEFRNAVGWEAAKASGSCQALAIRALAWAILVESALLSDHLLADMQRTEKAKGAAFLPGHPLAFYGPDPDPTARQAFNEYVRVRWPIHTFAVDPVNQEQNVSDAYARRRETQLALALAFTGGQIGANNFTRFSRQLDYELQTIELNRTVVGFSHGADTFGWRLYPRVQAPPVDGNAKVAFRDLLCGGPKRDHDLKQRQLEPGARELLAIVIMPSFVPYLRLDARTNWFQLTDPNRKQFTTEDSVRMGQMISYVKHCKTQCLAEGGMTRPGDVRRLLTAVDQLEKRLPLQDTLVQIPYQNSQGGFRLFADGTKNLGPELIGFYGEPGYNIAQESALFLVGDNFNVNVTKVVIGGQEANYDLLSRQVMRVTLKPNATTMMIQQFYDGIPKEIEVVDAHVATPYGVSSHLYIPVVRQPAPAANPYAFNPGETFGCLTYGNCLANGVEISERVVKLTGVPKGKQGKLTVSVTAIFGDGKERTLTRLVDVPKPGTQDPKLPVSVVGVDGDLVSFSHDVISALLGEFFTGNAAPRAQENVAALRVTAKLALDGATAAVDVTPWLIKIGCSNRNCVTCPVSAPAEPVSSAPAACPMGCPSAVWAAPAQSMNGLAPAPAPGRPGGTSTQANRLEFPAVRSGSSDATSGPQETTPSPIPILMPPMTSPGEGGTGVGKEAPAPKTSQGASPVRSAKGWLPVLGGARR